jgi:uncharacterized protein (TIGR02246 family)
LRSAGNRDEFLSVKLSGEIRMSNRTQSSALLGAAALALVLATSGCGHKGATAADLEAAQKAIQADQVKWNQDFKAKNLEGLLGHYSDDAYFVADGPAADGSTAIRKGYSDALTDNYFSVTFASDKIDVANAGDMAYARGHFTEKHQDRKTGKIVTTSGSYLTVYKKQDDGSWKAVEDFASGDPATTKSEAVPAAKPAKMISF